MGEYPTIFNDGETNAYPNERTVYFLQLDVVTSFSSQFILWESFRETSGQANVYFFFFSFSPPMRFFYAWKLSRCVNKKAWTTKKQMKNSFS